MVATAMALLVSGGCNIVGRVSTPDGGIFWVTPATADSTDPAMSGDGRYVVFTSSADDLVPGDDNGVDDIFRRDLTTGTIVRVSVASGGAEADGASRTPTVSRNGRHVAFVSDATDLVPNDRNGESDVFVRDVESGTTSRASISSTNSQIFGASTQPAISATGRYVAFVSADDAVVPGDTNGVADVFVRDREAPGTTRVSVAANGAEAHGPSGAPSITGSGAWVAFQSSAPDLVAGDANGKDDVFVVARTGGTVRRSSTANSPRTQESNGDSSRPSVVDPIPGYPGSGDPVVAYESTSTNLAGVDTNGAGRDVFLTSFVGGTTPRTLRVSLGAEESSHVALGVPPGGTAVVAVFERTGGEAGGDVLSVELATPTTVLAPVAALVSTSNIQRAASGPSSRPAISADGRFAAFRSESVDLVGGDLGPSLGDILVGRALQTSITSVSPTTVGVGQTELLHVFGSGFEPTSTARVFSATDVVNSVTYVSPHELIVSVTATAATPGTTARELGVRTLGAGGSWSGASFASCPDCFDVESVVEQPGPVTVELTSISVDLGTAPFTLPPCTPGACPSFPATVDADGNLDFGLANVELAAIPLDLELIPGFPITIELVPTFTAPTGAVVPANGAMQLQVGFAVYLRAALLPATCAIGPVQADLSAGPGGDPTGTPYDQTTGTAELHGSFTEALSVSGCGLFTGILNTAFGMPIPITENSVAVGIRITPILTGTLVP